MYFAIAILIDFYFSCKSIKEWIMFRINLISCAYKWIGYIKMASQFYSRYFFD